MFQALIWLVVFLVFLDHIKEHEKLKHALFMLICILVKHRRVWVLEKYKISTEFTNFVNKGI